MNGAAAPLCALFLAPELGVRAKTVAGGDACLTEAWALRMEVFASATASPLPCPRVF